MRDVAAKPPGTALRVASSFVMAAALHAAILLSSMPVGESRPPETPADRFVLVDAVTVEQPPSPVAPPPEPAPEPPPAEAPLTAAPPEPVLVETQPAEEQEPPQEPAPAAAIQAPAVQNEAAVMAPVETPSPGPSPRSTPAPHQAQLDPGPSSEAGSAGPGTLAAPQAAEGTRDVYIPFYRVDTKPQFRLRGELRYPEVARRLGLSGTVVVEADIDREGTVRAVRVVKSAGHGFDEAALEMVRDSTFTPARAGGKDVPVRARLTVDFRS